jgi:hypothetical protein
MGKVGGGRKQWVFCFCADVLFRVLFNRPELLLIRLPLPRALGGGARARAGWRAARSAAPHPAQRGTSTKSENNRSAGSIVSNTKSG